MAPKPPKPVAEGGFSITHDSSADSPAPELGSDAQQRDVAAVAVVRSVLEHLVADGAIDAHEADILASTARKAWSEGIFIT